MTPPHPTAPYPSVKTFALENIPSMCLLPRHERRRKVFQQIMVFKHGSLIHHAFMLKHHVQGEWMLIQLH